MMKKRGFTLLEVTLVIVISSSILTTLYGIMTLLPKVKNTNDARQNLIQQTNDVIDSFARIFQDYTIDYEEYFNRQMVGCNSNKRGGNFQWSLNASGHCNEFTAYGNENSSRVPTDELKQHFLSYCSSNGGLGLLNFVNCQSANLPNDRNLGRQSYGQYKWLFWDIRGDTDGQTINGVTELSLVEKYKPLEFGDSDDRDEWTWPDAVWDSDGVQELYLISHDKTRRLFLRRTLKEYKDRNGVASTGYTIQILKLRGFDAGRKHAFKAEEDLEVYDGQVDTWACDYGQKFSCKGDDIPNYAWYKLPKDKDDWWVDLFDDNLNIVHWNIQISPVRDPDLARAIDDGQINPFIKMSLTAQLNQHLWANKVWGDTKNFQYTLQNVYDTKGFYLR